ncbi:hypothetical protein AVEN_266505-1 [Araneus ventricosus]|uniref:Uncharacterized protein n=1 Tax=Araneus ventricosus TaxID=182803 RepID=A0A4Y2I4E2_ARAVE|nr:hypothetical protein AVEN_266505-1 [Araneus ventricosus]
MQTNDATSLFSQTYSRILTLEGEHRTCEAARINYRKLTPQRKNSRFTAAAFKVTLANNNRYFKNLPSFLSQKTQRALAYLCRIANANGLIVTIYRYSNYKYEMERLETLLAEKSSNKESINEKNKIDVELVRDQKSNSEKELGICYRHHPMYANELIDRVSWRRTCQIYHQLFHSHSYRTDVFFGYAQSLPGH